MSQASVAFHGSGADFDEFRLEMIGTGEGAQAYGYGLYFTDSEDIAKYYKDTVSARQEFMTNERMGQKVCRIWEPVIFRY